MWDVNSLAEEFFGGMGISYILTMWDVNSKKGKGSVSDTQVIY